MKCSSHHLSNFRFNCAANCLITTESILWPSWTAVLSGMSTKGKKITSIIWMYSQEEISALEELCPFRCSSISGHEIFLLQISVCKPEIFSLPIKYSSHKDVWQPVLLLIIFSNCSTISSYLHLPFPPSLCQVHFFGCPIFCSVRSLRQEINLFAVVYRC